MTTDDDYISQGTTLAAKLIFPAIALAAEVALTSSKTCFALSYPIAADGLGQAGA